MFGHFNLEACLISGCYLGLGGKKSVCIQFSFFKVKFSNTKGTISISVLAT